jgi:hypothetical protein
MDEDKALVVLEQIEDPEIRKIVATDPEVKQAIYNAMNYAVDSTALKSIRSMMNGPDVPDGVKKDLLLGWLEHRRKDREVTHRLTSGATADGITFNVNFATDAEVSNVKRARQVFGVEAAEDAEVRPEDD